MLNFVQFNLEMSLMLNYDAIMTFLGGGGGGSYGGGGGGSYGGGGGGYGGGGGRSYGMLLNFRG